MATIIEYDGKRYLFTFSKPETEWISELAKGMGITKEAVVGAAMNNGLTHYVGSFLREDEPPDNSISSEDLTSEHL